MKTPKILKRFIFFDEQDRVLERAVAYRAPSGSFVIRAEATWAGQGLYGKLPKGLGWDGSDLLMKTILKERFGNKVKIGGRSGVKIISLLKGQVADIDPKFGWRDRESFKSPPQPEEIQIQRL